MEGLKRSLILLIINSRPSNITRLVTLVIEPSLLIYPGRILIFYIRPDLINRRFIPFFTRPLAHGLGRKNMKKKIPNPWRKSRERKGINRSPLWPIGPIDMEGSENRYTNFKEISRQTCSMLPVPACSDPSLSIKGDPAVTRRGMRIAS